MSKPTEHPEVIAAQDAAWTIKDTLDDLLPRSLSTKDKAVLASITRDLGRLHERIVAIRDKRKRGPSEDEAAEREPAEAPSLFDSSAMQRDQLARSGGEA